MSSIGSGPGIISGPIVETGALREVGSADHPAAPQSGVAAAAAGIAAPAPAVVTSAALDAGAVPVDQARVAAIRRAIETNSYPVIPTRIGDAMIAAGMLLRMPK